MSAHEDASDPPVTPPVSPRAAIEPPKQTTEGIHVSEESHNLPAEVDEFGLPIARPRRIAVTRRSSDSEDEAADGKLGNQAPEKEADAASIRDDDQALRDPGAKSTIPQRSSSGASEKLEAGNTSLQQSDMTCSNGDEPSENKQGVQDKHYHGHSESRNAFFAESSDGQHPGAASEWSHQQLSQLHQDNKPTSEEEWQDMPAYAPFDIYNDDGKLIAREREELDDEMVAYGNLGGAGKGYTRVQLDEDAQSATSMDDNTAYLFRENGTNVADEEEEEARDPLSQMQATKSLLTDEQRIAYVGLTRLAMAAMVKDMDSLERTKGAKKEIDLAIESLKMWSQKMMVRLYSHMDIDEKEQIMIEQLAEHGLEPPDLTPALMRNARVKNPVASSDNAFRPPSISSPTPDSRSEKTRSMPSTPNPSASSDALSPPPYQEHTGDDLPEVRTPSQLPDTKNIDIDLRWTVLCDLFLVLIADSVYDARSRQLLEQVGSFLSVPWLEICRFEKRVTDALEMQEAAEKENWNEEGHMQNRKKMARNKRLMMMGLATVGGGLVIGLSAGLLAPVIGAGLAAGFTTIGVAGTSGFLAGAGGAAIVTTTGVLTGGTIAVRATNRRMGAVKTFEYRPLHNNKRVNLIVTVSGWMNGKIDDVRLPYSTVDPVMGDIYSVFWEPEMLQSMGDTINILATEALTQGLQQVLGSTILIALMASLQAPILLTKLSYLIDNPWTVSQARADAAGLILADSLIDRNLGVRPVTLVGFSLGARLIFSCLRELANKGAYGLVQNVYLFGSPTINKKDEYLRAKSVVPGRFVNGYATNDWILGYLFRATSGGIMRVAGLAPVDVPGIENINVTDLVPGHMAYRAAMPRLLREVGWMVESDEFTEIEDPDPENHEKRQRELINEIEEARKQLQKKPEKRRFGIFRSKKLAERKEWETYDERIKHGADNKDAKGDEPKDGNVLFDIDAIRAEAAELAAQGIQIKQLDSTLPPMKLQVSQPDTRNPYLTLRGTKSFDDSMAAGLKPTKDASSVSVTAVPNGYDAEPSSRSREQNEYEDAAEAGVSMTFEPALETSPVPTPLRSSAPRSPAMSSDVDSREPAETIQGSPAPRPPLRSSVTVPNVHASLEHNAWADEDDEEFGREKEVQMTFE